MYNLKLHFHFIGIGGSGMSGIARILLEMGFVVSGSDLKETNICKQLTAAGAHVEYGHSADNIPPGASMVVYSSAVRTSNPEMLAAHERGLPIVRRAEVLAELMRLKFAVGVAGSHGKTTTTSMLGAIMEYANLDPTVIIGGVVKAFGSGGKFGRGDYLVAETDESDRSFLLLKPTIAIVTNIDDEHTNAYASREDLNNSFQQFVEAVPFYGLAVLCIDDARVRALRKLVKRRVVTYGFSPDADIQALAVEQKAGICSFDLQVNSKNCGKMMLPMPGRHLVSNCLAAIAVALEFGISVEQVRQALVGFEGVARRLEKVLQQSGITLIDDYAHHPTELKASMTAVKEGWLKSSSGRLLVVHQPHRYSRVRDCFPEYLAAFDLADVVFVSDIYSAGEDAIEGISSEELCKRSAHKNINYVPELADIVDRVLSIARSGDVILCMGAGSVTNFAHELAEKLAFRPALIA